MRELTVRELKTKLLENNTKRAEREWNEKNPKQKVGAHIKKVLAELAVIEKALKDSEKIKKEGDLKSGSYWVRTKRGMSKIEEKMTKIGHSLKRLQA